MSAFDEFIAAGVAEGWYGTVNRSGILRGGSLIEPGAGVATGSPMLRLKAIQSADIGIPQPDQVPIGGDNVSNGNFNFASEDPVAFTITKGVFQMILDGLMQGTKILTRGGMKFGVLAPRNYDPADMCWIIQSQVKKQNTGLRGLSGWHGYIIPISSASPMGRDNFATRAAAADRVRVTCQPADKMPNGVLIDDTNFDVEGGAVIPFTSDYPIYMQRFTGNGVLDTFTLAKAAAENSGDVVRVDVNGVAQVYGTDFTVSGTSLVFDDEPAENAEIVATVGYRP